MVDFICLLQVRAASNNDLALGLLAADTSASCPSIAAQVLVRSHVDCYVQSHAYAVVGQKHPGWVGFLQARLSLFNELIHFNLGLDRCRRTCCRRSTACGSTAASSRTERSWRSASRS